MTAAASTLTDPSRAILGCTRCASGWLPSAALWIFEAPSEEARALALACHWLLLPNTRSIRNEPRSCADLSPSVAQHWRVEACASAAAASSLRLKAVKRAVPLWIPSIQREGRLLRDALQGPPDLGEQFVDVERLLYVPGRAACCTVFHEIRVGTDEHDRNRCRIRGALEGLQNIEARRSRQCQVQQDDRWTAFARQPDSLFAVLSG